MTGPDIITGGCLCGAIRYEVQGPALQTTLCHCQDCQRASGAPVVAWTFFPSGTLAWIRGVPKTIRFAERERSFCGDCGTPLRFFDPALPHLFEVTTVSLDHPCRQPPADECWIRDAQPWLQTNHHLPRYPESAPLPEIP